MATFDIATDPADPICSRAGCREVAVFRVNWRNPRIHPTDRVKVWAACGDHRDFLADYLRSRSFPVTVTGMDEDLAHLDDRDPDRARAADQEVVPRGAVTSGGVTSGGAERMDGGAA